MIIIDKMEKIQPAKIKSERCVGEKDKPRPLK